MFSNIPINLLSETQLGGCTALSCVLGRRREERGKRRRRGRAELTFVPTRRESVCEPTVCAHTCSYTHACMHIRKSTGLMWLQSTLAHLLVCMLMFGVWTPALHRSINDQYCLWICQTVVCHCRAHLSLLSSFDLDFLSHYHNHQLIHWRNWALAASPVTAEYTVLLGLVWMCLNLGISQHGFISLLFLCFTSCLLATKIRQVTES